MINCPLCDAAIDAEEEELDEGDVITCEECGAEVQVMGVNPLELEAAEDEDEDEEESEEEEEDTDERWH